MSSVQTIARTSFAAVTARRERLFRRLHDPADRPADCTPAISEALDIKNIRRANPYAEPSAWRSIPPRTLRLEGAAGLVARYDKEAAQVIERICGASFKLLLRMRWRDPYGALRFALHRRIASPAIWPAIVSPVTRPV